MLLMGLVDYSEDPRFIFFYLFLMGFFIITCGEMKYAEWALDGSDVSAGISLSD